MRYASISQNFQLGHTSTSVKCQPPVSQLVAIVLEVFVLFLRGSKNDILPDQKGKETGRISSEGIDGMQKLDGVG